MSRKTYLKDKHLIYQNPKPWLEIEDYFNQNFQGYASDISVLIRHIINSEYASRLYGGTSMDLLIISPNEKINRYLEALQVTFDREKKKIVFKYFGGPGDGHSLYEAQFTRTYDVSKVREKFDQFVEWIKW